MTSAPDRGLVALAAVLELEKRARAARSAEELGFLMVNDTHLVVGYRQAAFHRAGSRTLTALSGLATPDPDAPFTRRLAKALAARLAGPGGEAVAAAPLAALAEGSPDREEAERFFAEHLPGSLAFVPLARGGETLGALLLARSEPFGPHDVAVLAHLADAYGHAYAALVGPRGRARRLARRRVAALAAVAAAAAILALPVRQSALAPAEVVARDAALVRAPLSGVIEAVHVRPNEPVEAGSLLVTLDGRELAARLEVARQGLAVAEAELRQAQQQALFDERSRAQLALLQGRREQHAAEAAFLEETIGRLRVSAPRAGLAVFDDVAELEGRPVALGERILLVADPAERELEIDLPVSDAIVLEPGAETLLFLNIDPADPIPGRLLRAGYRAAPTPDGVMAYRLRAEFTVEDPRLRIGLRGTAKLYGEETSLFLHLLRRPLAAARLWLGL